MKKLDFLKSFESLLIEVQEVKKLQSKALNILENQALFQPDISNKDEEWISVKETCKILGCSEVTLWKLRKSNTLPFSKLNRTIRFKKIEVFNYLNQKK
ncbi:helix-turn-helix domain-containing protein [Flavobacterium sp.]|uniref:helix-turn-helix domain-containing protein n=1 Tax=Flavobacterium sp. TaxID=239 RepID=UPI002635589E|nr:helix-turn-helix domain-containing protein [Flavobacterium sp.]MDD3004492.1 helix-turn-helix domain-containing protein [Flavobacterium sp.]